MPTGIQVTCSVERSQQQNKRLAIALLKGRLEMIEQAKRDEELKKIYGEKGAIAWGNQIRSYVLDDRRVKDHRTTSRPAMSKACWTAASWTRSSMPSCGDASRTRNSLTRLGAQILLREQPQLRSQAESKYCPYLYQSHIHVQRPLGPINRLLASLRPVQTLTWPVKIFDRSDLSRDNAWTDCYRSAASTVRHAVNGVAVECHGCPSAVGCIYDR